MDQLTGRARMTLSKEKSRESIRVRREKSGDITHVAGTQVRSGRESEGSWEGRPSVHCSDRPFHRQEDHRTGWGPGYPRAGIRSEGVEGGLHWRRQVAGRGMGQKDWEVRPGWPGRPERQHAHAPQWPYAEPLPPSCEPSIPCGFP